MKYHNSSLLYYCIKHDKVEFYCAGLNKNEKEVASIFDNFLLDISEANNVFLHTYRLSDINDIVDSRTVIARADVLFDSYNSYFNLSEARVKSACFANDTCCEVQFLFFNKKVKWEDFLASSIFEMRKKLFKSGLLSAIFYVNDHGADFVFECNKTYKEKVFNFFDELSKMDWQIKKVEKLEY